MERGKDAEIAVDALDNVYIHNQGLSESGRVWTNSSGTWAYTDIGITRSTVAALNVDANNVPHIIFENGADLKYAYLELGTWVSSSIEAGRVYIDPHLVIDGNGKAHVSYYADKEVMYASNASGTWQTELLNNDTDTYANQNQDGLLTAIKLDFNDKVHIAYVTYGPNWEFRYATNRSGRWEDSLVDTVREPGTQNNPNIDMEIDVGGNIHLIYQGGWDYALKHATNQSGEWVLDYILSEGWRNTNYYVLAIDSQGYLHVAYINGRFSGGGTMYYDNNIDSKWEFSPVVSRRASDASLDMKLDSINQVHIVYNDSPGKSRYLTNRIP